MADEDGEGAAAAEVPVQNEESAGLMRSFGDQISIESEKTVRYL